MIVLGVAVEMAQLDLLGIEPYVERLARLGVGAIEAQLSPEMSGHEIARWSATIDAAAGYGLAVGFRAPMPPVPSAAWPGRPPHPAWPPLLDLARGAPIRPATVIVHACAGPRRDPALAACTVDHLRALADAAPELLITLENSANVERGPAARMRAWLARRRRAAAARARPGGAGSAMGAPRAVPQPAVDEPVDAALPALPRSLRWNAAGSRAAAREICDTVARSNCSPAWDLAHDWLAGRELDRQAALPGGEFLRRVGYVRVHDVDDSGSDHCLLVMGNVPYTTQLRALLAAGYSGTVCLAARYTVGMRPYGGRWQAFEQSLTILKHALKLA